MKLQWITLLFLSLISVSTLGQYPAVPYAKGTLEERGLEQKFKRYRAFENGVLYHEVFFDEAGRKTVEKRWHPKRGDFSLHLSFKYDEEGRTIEQLTYNAEEQVVQSVLTEYDGTKKTVWTIPGPVASRDFLNNKKEIFQADTLLIEEVFYREGKHNISTVYDLHANGTVASKSQFRGPSATPISTIKFDEKGQQTTNIRYNNEGRPQNTIQYQYNEEGEVINRKSFNAEDKLYAELSTDLDKKGNITAIYNWKEGGEKQKIWVYERDKQGRLLHKYSVDSQVQDYLKTFVEESFQYDSKGRVVLFVTNKRYDLELTQYEYLDNDIVLERFSSFNGQVRPKDALNQLDAFTVKREQRRQITTDLILAEVNYSQGQVLSTINYEYDANGNMTKMERFNADKTAGRVIEQLFDEKNRVLDSKEFKVKGEERVLVKESKYQFDAQDHMLLSSVCRRMDRDGGECRIINEEYDVNGNLTYRVERENESLKSEFKYKYNDAGEVTYFSTLFGSVRYVYDDKGNVSQQIFMDAKGNETGSNVWEVLYQQ